MISRRGWLLGASALLALPRRSVAEVLTQSPNPVSPYAGAATFGTGADGTVSLSSGTTTLTRDMHYAALTLSGTAAIKTNGWRIYVAATLDISNAAAGAIQNNGANAQSPNATGTASPGGVVGPVAAATLPGAQIQGGDNWGSLGVSGATGAGNAGGASNSPSALIVGGQGGAGGAGGGTGSAGGAGVAGAALISSLIAVTNGLALPAPGPPPLIALPAFGQGIFPVLSGLPGGAGGSGAGDGTNLGGASGSGGQGGGWVYIAAATVQRGSNATAGIIQAKGASGGTGWGPAVGNVGGGAGGGGGGGGAVKIDIGQLLGSAITGAIDVSGGAGGAGGNGVGTGKGGNGGGGGNSGSAYVLVLNRAGATTGITSGSSVSASGYNQTTFNSAGSAGGTTSTSTSAAGGAGATLQVSL